MVVGILRDGGTEVAGWGVLDVESQSPVGRHTPFPIASITKAWTATLVMQLVDKELVDLDAAVIGRLPELTARGGSQLQDVTTRQLLSHSSGIEGDFFLDTGSGEDALERYVAQCGNVEMVHPPGAAASYCNTGMILLGRLVEVVTGRPWHSALSSSLIEPLRLSRTTAGPPERASWRCHGHAGGRGERRVATGLMPHAAGPAGTMWSTPEELLQFVKLHLPSGEALRRRTGLSRDAVQLMQAPQALVPGPDWLMCPRAWGLGWSLYGWTGGRVIGHDGGGPGTASFLRVVPDADVAVAALVNVGDAGPAVARLVADLVEELTRVRAPGPLLPSARPAAAEVVDQVVGRYRGSSTVFNVQRIGAELVLRQGAPEDPSGPPVSRTSGLHVLDPVAGTYLLEPSPEFDAWMPVTFSTLPDGRRVMHMAGRIARAEAAQAGS